MTAELGGGQVSLRPAWGLSDRRIAEDAKAFWRRLSRLEPAEIERRVSELCAAAYVDDTLAGVATAYLQRWEPLRARFAFFRCLIVPGERHDAIARQLALLSRQLLERWSRENPNERVLGMAAVVPAAAYREQRGEPMWSEGGLNLNLVGYTSAGDQFRIAWFAEARLDQDAVAAPRA